MYLRRCKSYFHCFRASALTPSRYAQNTQVRLLSTGALATYLWFIHGHTGIAVQNAPAAPEVGEYAVLLRNLSYDYL